VASALTNSWNLQVSLFLKQYTKSTLRLPASAYFLLVVQATTAAMAWLLLGTFISMDTHQPCTTRSQHKKPIFEGLQKQLKNLHIKFDNESKFEDLAKDTDLIVDALFGFSFKPPVREPFDEAIKVMESGVKPVLAVDTPSSWHVEDGPQNEGIGSKYMPDYLISLTAAKPNVGHFKGKKHFIGGRFLGEDVAKKYSLNIPEYQGVDQIVEVPVDVRVEKL